jgi:hypothetical protein
MKIWLMYDYDDRVIRASCDGLALQQEAEKMNGGPDEYRAYYVTDLELEDVPPEVLKAWVDDQKEGR